MTKFIALIAFLLPTYLVRFEVAGVPTTLLELLIYGVLLVGVVRLFSDSTSRERLMRRRIWLLPAFLILVGATLGVLVAPDVRIALGLWKGFILDPILVYLLALAFVDGEEDAATVALGLVLGAGAVAIWALLDGNFSTSLEENRTIGPYAADPNASPNYLAFAIAPVLPLVVWLLRRRSYTPPPSLPKSSSSKSEHFASVPGGVVPRLRDASIVAWLIVVPIITALSLSGSRAGLVAGLGGLVIAWILGAKLLTTYYLLLTRCLVVLLLLAAAASWFFVRPDFTLAPEAGGRITASNNVRWQLWSATGELVEQHWLLGTGLGGFQTRFTNLTADRVNYPEFIAPKARTPHNLLVGVWMEVGLIGLLGLITALVLVGRTLFGALRLRSGHIAAAALLGSWFVLLTHGLVDQPIWKNDSMILFWLLVALPVVILPKHSGEE